MYFKIMNYRTNRGRRLEKYLNRLLDQAETGPSMPNSWWLMMMIMSIFQIKVTNKVMLVNIVCVTECMRQLRNFTPRNNIQQQRRGCR